MNKNFIALMIVIILDMITTFVGINIGLSESNPLGVWIVLILNMIVVTFFWNKRNEKGTKLINKTAMIVAVYRGGVVLWNIFLIGMILIQ